MKIKKMGIYCILNTKYNKMYIGSSINIDSRLNNHKKHLNNNSHINKKLQRAYNKNKKYFTFKILEEIKDKNKLIKREQHWIDLYSSVQNGYNIRLKAESNLGIKFSKAHKNKIGKANKGKIRSEETLQKLSESHIGILQSEKTKLKISKGMKGKTNSKGFKHPEGAYTERAEKMKKWWASPAGKLNKEKRRKYGYCLHNLHGR